MINITTPTIIPTISPIFVYDYFVVLPGAINGAS
jgi:hypothetical protein